jgi:hypothetical protein
MQIDSFVIYHRDGIRRRVLSMHEGLNVITGWRNTGKSSLLEIIEYCFGRSELTVSHGKVRRTVGWYGLVLRDGDRYAFAARPAPRGTAASTSDAMWLPLSGREAPPADQLSVNTDRKALREQLSSFSGFADVRFDPPQDASRPPLLLHVAHVLPVCLQDEEDIDSKTRLFHRGHNQNVMQALRDALPYLLGAADEEAPALRSRLTVVNRELAQAQRTLGRMLAVAREADARELTLLTLAARVGLVEAVDAGDPPAGETAIGLLRSAEAADPEATPSVEPAGEIEAHLSRRRDLQDDLDRAERDEALLRTFGNERQAFVSETAEQRARLASIGLLPDSAGHAACPLCESPLQTPDPTAATLTTHLEGLDSELRSIAEVEPRDREALQAAGRATEQARRRVRDVNAALRDLATRDRNSATARTLASRRANVQGRISEYLAARGLDGPSMGHQLGEQIAVLSATRDTLARQLDTDAEAERLSGALNIIGAEMTRLARLQGLEHSEGGQVRLELGRMTLVADTVREGSFPLSGIGGAGTRVGYHLAALLAIHSLLRERDRPGPSFLMLDHPTGPFYPDDTPDGQEPVLRHEDDRTIVASIFEMLRDVAEKLDGSLQIIVCDHARFPDDWFADALVEDWREGRGLVPSDWEDEIPQLPVSS